MSADGSVVEQPDPLAEHRQRIQMLQAELDAERLRHIAESKRKDEEIERMKKNAVTMQARMEEEEEHITNSLVKRLEALRKEKELLALQVENEEEFMTNTLQKKLAQLRQEKVELENHLEVEQEYIVNKLQKQLLEVTRQKNALERRLNEGRSGLISKLEQSVGEFQESLASDSQKERDTAQQLELQIKFLREQHTNAAAEAEQYRVKCEGLVEKLQALNTEKYKAQFEAQMFKEKLEKLQLQREQELVEEELHEEREFNMERRRNRRLSDAAHAGQTLPEEDPGVARLRFRSYSDIQYKSVDDTPRARSASLNSCIRPACFTPPETPSPRDPLSLKRHTEDILKYGVHSTPPHLPSPASMSPSASPLPFGHPYLAEIHRPKPRTGSASLADRRGIDASALLRSASGSSASSAGRGALAEPRTPKSENE